MLVYHAATSRAFPDCRVVDSFIFEGHVDEKPPSVQPREKSREKDRGDGGEGRRTLPIAVQNLLIGPSYLGNRLGTRDRAQKELPWRALLTGRARQLTPGGLFSFFSRAGETKDSPNEPQGAFHRATGEVLRVLPAPLLVSSRYWVVSSNYSPRFFPLPLSVFDFYRVLVR